jgi:hypothetical protein
MAVILVPVVGCPILAGRRVLIERTVHGPAGTGSTHRITLIQHAVTLYFAIVNSYIPVAGVRTGYGNKR